MSIHQQRHDYYPDVNQPHLQKTMQSTFHNEMPDSHTGLNSL